MARRSGRAANGRSSIYPGADGRWHGRVSMGVRDDGRPDRRHVTGRSERDVTAKVRALEQARDAGLITDPGRAPTVETWLDHWLDHIAARSVKPKTLEGYRSIVRAHLTPGLGGHRLDRLQPEHVDALYTRLERGGLAPASVSAVHRVLRAALNEAVSRDRLTRNPVLRAKAPRHDDTEVEPLTAAEALRVLAAAATRRNPARWSVALALGLRQGEALGLHWTDLDLDTATLTVRRKIQRLSWQHGCAGRCGRTRGADCPHRYGGGLVTNSPKSRAGRRTIALPHPLTDALRAHRSSQAAERHAAGDLWEEHNLVFAQPTGRPIDPRDDWAEWRALLADAGVRTTKLHTARHTAATLLLIQNVDPRTVMDIMGWSEQRMLLRYQHVVDELRREAARRIANTLWPTTETTTETEPDPTDHHHTR